MQAGEALSGTLNSIHNLAYYLGIMQRVRADLQSAGTPATPLETNQAPR
jgi:queuine tRNA-ribosyltransferase